MNAMYHIFYGNDAPAWQTAAARALVSAIGTGLLAWLAVWTTDASNQTQVAAGLVPFVGIVVARFGLEGAADTHKGRKKR